MKVKINNKIHKLSTAQTQQVENLMNDKSAFLVKTSYYNFQLVVSYRTGERTEEAYFNRPTLDALIKREVIVEVKPNYYKLNPNMEIV